jgi:TRAP-type C4-dicarboxylate transport system permease small subunit
MKKLTLSPKKIVLALLDHFESYVCQVLLTFFVITLLMQIILRTIDYNLHWTEEIARYAFLWFILFGTCYATRLCALNRVTHAIRKIFTHRGSNMHVFQRHDLAVFLSDHGLERPT